MCDICKMYPCHYRCPNYKPSQAVHYCTFCGDGIYNGEEYCVNIDDEYAHYDCLCNLSTRNLLDWLGDKIMSMDYMKEDEFD